MFYMGLLDFFRRKGNMPPSSTGVMKVLPSARPTPTVSPGPKINLQEIRARMVQFAQNGQLAEFLEESLRVRGSETSEVAAEVLVSEPAFAESLAQALTSTYAVVRKSGRTGARGYANDPLRRAIGKAMFEEALGEVRSKMAGNLMDMGRAAHLLMRAIRRDPSLGNRIAIENSLRHVEHSTDPFVSGNAEEALRILREANKLPPNSTSQTLGHPKPKSEIQYTEGGVHQLHHEQPFRAVTACKEWKCPKCGGLLGKTVLGILIQPGGNADSISGTATCPCGGEFRQSDVYSGMFDIKPAIVPVTAEKIPCSVCGAATYLGSEFDLSNPASREAAVKGGLGFQCQNQKCGAVYCFACITKASAHPALGKGKVCPTCGLGSMDMLKSEPQVRSGTVSLLEGAHVRTAQIQQPPLFIQGHLTTTPIARLTFESMLHTYAVSAESLRWAYVKEKDNIQWVVLDGLKGPEYLAIQKGTLVFSPDGKRLAYVFCRGTETLAHRALSVDEMEGKLYDQIPTGTIVFSPDSTRVAYIAERERTLGVVADGQEGNGYESLLPEVVFSPDSRRVAYVARRGGRWLSVIDGLEGKDHDYVAGHVFSPDSRHVVSVIQRSTSWYLVLDDEVVGEGLDGVLKDSIAFYSGNRRIAYAVKRADKAVVIADGVPGKEYDVIARGSLHISPDGRRMAYAVKDKGRVFAVVDGVEEHKCDSIHWGTPLFSPDSQHVVYVAKHGEHCFVVADGKEIVDVPGEGLPFPESNRIVFDSPNSFHMLGRRGVEFLRLDVRL
jgi:hypothetical protein